MNFSELWIGDAVYIKSLKRNAVWEGLNSPNSARIKLDDRIIMIPVSDLAEAKDELEEAFVFAEKEDSKIKLDPLTFPRSIDLHMEALNPSLNNQVPELILHHQINACKEYVAQAIEFRLTQIEIIHGKGTGALKNEVYHLLNAFPEVYNKIEKGDGGAVEVWFNYS